MTNTAVQEFQKIKEHAESIKNDADHHLTVMSPGDMWAQGDIGIVMLADLPKGAVAIPYERQLAPGTTQGSRHCLVEQVEMFRLPNPTALDGPIFRSEVETTVEHPEHGNITVPPGVFGIVYQRQYAEELRRVID